MKLFCCDETFPSRHLGATIESFLTGLERRGRRRTRNGDSHYLEYHRYCSKYSRLRTYVQVEDYLSRWVFPPYYDAVEIYVQSYVVVMESIIASPNPAGT